MGRLGYYSKVSFQAPKEVIPKKIWSWLDGCSVAVRADKGWAVKRAPRSSFNV